MAWEAILCSRAAGFSALPARAGVRQKRIARTGIRKRAVLKNCFPSDPLWVILFFIFVHPVNDAQASLVKEIPGKTFNADVHAEHHMHEHAPVANSNAFPGIIQGQGVFRDGEHID